jgi:hypothetical protein
MKAYVVTKQIKNENIEIVAVTLRLGAALGKQINVELEEASAGTHAMVDVTEFDIEE